MSADFNTFIHLRGTKEELIAMLQVIKNFEDKNYQQYKDKHDCAYINSVQIANKGNLFFTNKTKYLKKLTEEKLISFFEKCKDGIFVSASGPWGVFGFLDEISLFEEMAEAAPNASFDANITGWNTGGDQDAEFELTEGLLYSRYAFHMDDENFDEHDKDCDDEYDDIDRPCEWDVENVYDPVKKEIIESHYDD